VKEYAHPFEPIVDENSQVLILGSFPSFDSFKYSFYYANRYNAFWKIMSEIYGVELNSNEEKKEFLLDKKIALWDMIKSCSRDSSLDSKLQDIVINDIDGFLKKYPNIQKIGCNGRKSYDLLLKNFKSLKEMAYYLPSTSSANARMSYKEKFEIYKRFLNA